MKFVSHEIETKKNGQKIVRNFFIYDKAVSYIKEVSKEFSKDEKKQAKFNHKVALKNKANYNTQRRNLIEHLAGCSIPNYNIKFSVLTQS